MKQITYTKTQMHERKGYIFDGTIECAKSIVHEIHKLNPEWAAPFNLKINLLDDSIHFDWGRYDIKNGDFVALRNDSNMMHEVIEILTHDELNRWGFEQKK